MFALLEIARIYKALKRFADFLGVKYISAAFKFTEFFTPFTLR